MEPAMSTRQKIVLSFAILAVSSLLFFIIFGENGWVDLKQLRQEKQRLLLENKKLEKENLSLYREIDRLKNDMTYIESIARQELGMIKADELILKLKKPGGNNP